MTMSLGKQGRKPRKEAGVSQLFISLWWGNVTISFGMFSWNAVDVRCWYLLSFMCCTSCGKLVEVIRTCTGFCGNDDG